MVGLAQLRRDLRRIDPKWGKELGKANFDAASVVVVEASQRAPKGPHEGSGRVAPISTTITALRRQQAATVAIGGARSPHAVVTEFGGTVPRRGSDKATIRKAQRGKRSFIQHGLQVTHVRKQAYLYPAIDATREKVLFVYQGAVNTIMGEAFR